MLGKSTKLHRLKHAKLNSIKKIKPVNRKINSNVFSSNYELVENLRNRGILKSLEIISVLKNIDRNDFLRYPNNMLIDRPNKLILNQTISAPHIHAKALEILKEKCIPGNRVLDIGCGSGYLVACFAELLNVDVNLKSQVVGIDIYRGLVNMSIENLKKEKYKKYLSIKHGGLNSNNNVTIICGNGWLGYKVLEKYDAIHVGAGAETLPIILFNQLNEGGIMIIPVSENKNNRNYKYRIIKKINGKLIETKDIGVRFVPLINNPKKIFSLNKKNRCIEK